MAWGRKDASRLSPKDIDRAWRRGLKAATDQDWAAAETWLERIVEADSSDLDAYHALAGLYRRQGAVGRAIRMHQNLLLRTDLPKEARSEALFELGRDFEEGGFAVRAAATYEEYLSQKPRSGDGALRLIPLLIEQREFARALVLARKLRRRDSEKAEELALEISFAEAQCQAGEGNADGAFKALKRCLRQNKSWAPALAMLGELEAERGKSAKALEAWKQAAKVDASVGAELYDKIGAGFAASKKGTGFEAFLREILEDRPTDAAARIALARALGSRGDAPEAIEELARAIEIRPEDLSLRAELGRQLLASNQDGEARKAYAQLIEQIERMPPVPAAQTAGEEEPGLG